jgi:hypothetical protein
MFNIEQAQIFIDKNHKYYIFYLTRLIQKLNRTRIFADQAVPDQVGDQRIFIFHIFFHVAYSLVTPQKPH